VKAFQCQQALYLLFAVGVDELAVKPASLT
jgi:hypothetical protein